MSDGAAGTRRKLVTADDVRVRVALATDEQEAMFAADFDDAIIGYFRRCGRPSVIAYSYEKCVAIIAARDGVSLDEAREWMDVNVVGGWHGEQTPAFIHDVPPVPSSRTPIG